VQISKTLEENKQTKKETRGIIAHDKNKLTEYHESKMREEESG
jgi:hypothetical protein